MARDTIGKIKEYRQGAPIADQTRGDDARPIIEKIIIHDKNMPLTSLSCF